MSVLRKSSKLVDGHCLLRVHEKDAGFCAPGYPYERTMKLLKTALLPLLTTNV